MPPTSPPLFAARLPEAARAAVPAPHDAGREAVEAPPVAPFAVDAAIQKRFDRLYRDHGARIYRWSLRLTGGDRDSADDLTQEVLLAAYTGLPRFAGRAAQTTWLYRIAVYRWRELRERDIRARGGGVRGGVYAGENAAANAAATPGDVATASLAETVTNRIVLEAALANLPDTLRVAFLLVKAEVLTYREAARVLETPQGTIQSRVHDARVLLQRSLVGSGYVAPASSIEKEPS